jgi:hypothetical protein
MLLRIDQRKQAAQRKRRYRARLARGGGVLNVPIQNMNALTEVLLNLKWLAYEKSEDRRAVSAAVGEMLDDLARH